jgi:hypothetical protein
MKDTSAIQCSKIKMLERKMLGSVQHKGHSL